MTTVMPQEIEVWYLIPALRREIASVLIKDHNLKQKEVAAILGITESAVSQYIKSKRAHELKFTAEEIAQIKKVAEEVIKDKSNVMKYMYDLCTAFRGSHSVCELHRKYDKKIGKECKVCLAVDH